MLQNEFLSFHFSPLIYNPLLNPHSFAHSLIHSFVHSFIHSFIHSFTHSLIHSLIHSFIHLFIHSFTHSFIYSCLQSMLAVDISETNSRLSLAIADQRITDGEIALNSKASVVRTYVRANMNAYMHAVSEHSLPV